MAFNDIGDYWLANGNSMWVSVRFAPAGVGQDRGAQWTMAGARPFSTFPTPSGTTQLETSNFQKRFIYSNGGTDWSYWCLVTNTYSPGWNATFFGLSGGGNA
jgi:hypothetical protein